MVCPLLNKRYKMVKYPLHKAVFDGDLTLLSDLLRDGNVDEKDLFGCTPLHIAVMLGKKDFVHTLLNHSADISVKNNSGWTPLAEAVSYGNRSMIKLLLRKLKQQNKDAMESKRPQLVSTLKKIEDFQLELKWEFHTWVPLLSRLLPSDTCKITKKGCNIRMDSTLIEFNDTKWQRGDISFIFNGNKSGTKSLLVLDNEKKVFQRLRQEILNSDFRLVLSDIVATFQQEQMPLSVDRELDSEIEEEVDYLMSCDIVAAQMSTKPITFNRTQTGWIFKEDRRENIGVYECEVFTVSGMTLISRKRREHLSDEDLQKNKALYEAFTRGESSAINNAEKVEHRESLPPPPISVSSWEEYLSADPLKPPHLGRKMILKEDRKSVKVTVWMSQDFPLSNDLLLGVLEVIAPSKHFTKLKEFIAMKLPPGFPAKIEIPVLPTISARITFQGFSWSPTLDDMLFEIPSDFKEDPNHFPDL